MADPHDGVMSYTEIPADDLERARAFYERRGFRAVAFGRSPAPENEPDVKYAWPVTPARSGATRVGR